MSVTWIGLVDSSKYADWTLVLSIQVGRQTNQKQMKSIEGTRVEILFEKWSVWSDQFARQTGLDTLIVEDSVINKWPVMSGN